jgi:ABC-2 type transport system permease protein
MSAMAAALGEVAKLPAFIRRDFLIAISYRVAFGGDLVLLGAQLIVFSFIGRLVDPARLPSYGGGPATYMEFVVIGVGLSLVTALLIGRVATAIRQEQLQGTLESLLATPTAVGTIQLGTIAFDLLWVPLRIGVLVLAVVLTFGLDLEPAGIPQAAVLLAAFLPFAWGLGLLSAAATLAFRRGGGATALVVSFLGIASGAYFPLSLLPGWLETASELNPLAIALDGMRESLLGGAGWAAVGVDLVVLLSLSVWVLTIGAATFRLALAREHRNGTLGLY